MMDHLPYWMQGLTDDERETLTIVQQKAVFDELDNSLESKIILLVSRMTALFNESEEIEIVEALDGGSFEEPEDEDD